MPNLGKYAASRRVARTIYLGSAPTVAAAHRGLEDRRIRLGCVMPGETPAVFGDALRRLASTATYLYQDGPRYWYATQPTVTKVAEERAQQLLRDPDRVAQEIERRLRQDLRQTGGFERIHAMPRSSSDLPDDLEARLVVLGTEHAYSKEPESPALKAAQALLESRGSAPRRFRNSLVFLAADRTRLADLDEAVRKYLAWASIVAERETLDLSPHQVKQAEAQLANADSVVVARLPEIYHWLLVPTQKTEDKGDPRAPVDWQAIRLSGQEGLAERASRKLRGDEHLLTVLGPSRLRMDLDRIPLWRGDHVPIRQLVEDFALYLYLPRLASPRVLLAAIQQGLGPLTWEQDTFAYAEAYDDAAGRYRGLACGQTVPVPDIDAPGLLVRPEVARRQLISELNPPVPLPGDGAEGTGEGSGGATLPGFVVGTNGDPIPPPLLRTGPKRYHGTVRLDPARAGRDASRVAEELIAHLVGLDGARVMVSLEIEAEIPAGAPENVVRIVTENGRVLSFESQGFEEE